MARETNQHEFDDELTPPNASRVAKRALVLASCACRSSLEEAPNHPQAIETYTMMMEWIPIVGIRDEFEPDEWAAITTALGDLDFRVRIQMSWRSEGLAVLAWSLSRMKLPAYDKPVSGPDIGDTIDFLLDEAQELITTAQLQPAHQLQWVADLTLAVHWRIREYTLNPIALDFGKFVKEMKWADFPIQDLRVKKKDLALRGKPIFKCNEDVIQECLSIAMERQHAANWLIGTEPLYSQVTCDT